MSQNILHKIKIKVTGLNTGIGIYCIDKTDMLMFAFRFEIYNELIFVL